MRCKVFQGIALLTIALLLMGASPALAQKPVAASQKTGSVKAAAPAFGATSPMTSRHKLGPGDELEVTLESFPERQQVIKVRPDGWVHIFPIGDVPAAGLTLVAFHKSLESRLGKRLKYPGAMVGLRSVSPLQVILLGEVGKPGQYAYTPGDSMTQLIAAAGGTTAGADLKSASLYRAGVAVPIPVMPPGSNSTYLQPGDIVYVQPAPRDVVSVNGAVFTPGVQLVTRQRSTVWDAVIGAGGPKPDAALTRVMVYRANAAGPTLVDLSEGPSSVGGSMPLEHGDLITIREQKAFIVGANNQINANLGAVPITGRETLIEVLATAGVRKTQFNQVAILHRKDLADGQLKPTTVNLNKALKSGDAAANVLVQDGDVIILNPPVEGLKLADVIPYVGLFSWLFR